MRAVDPAGDRLAHCSPSSPTLASEVPGGIFAISTSASAAQLASSFVAYSSETSASSTRPRLAHLGGAPASAARYSRIASSCLPAADARSPRKSAAAASPSSVPFVAPVAASSSSDTSSGAVAEPCHLSAGCSVLASTTHRVGHDFIGKCSRKLTFSAFSVLIASQTNRPAMGRIRSSGKTNDRMLWHVWHHGAHASTKSGLPLVLARASARG